MRPAAGPPPIPGRPSRCLLALLVGTLVLWPTPGDLEAQSDDDLFAAMAIGDHLGSRISAALNSVTEMRSEAARGSASIQASRTRFWEAVRTGQGVEAARADFASALWAKDLHYLLMAIPEGTDGPRATVVDALSGGLDGGIRPSARPQFDRWVTQIRVALGVEASPSSRGGGVPRMVIPGPAELAAAMEAAKDQQVFYLRARDWAEIDASRLIFPWDSDSRAYAFVLLQRYGPLRTPQEIRQNYAELVALFGEAAVLDAAERVREAPRRPDGQLASPEAMGIVSAVPLSAFTQLLASSDGGSFFAFRFWRSGAEPAEATRRHERLRWAYTDAKIDDAVERIRSKPSYRNDYIDPHEAITVGEYDVFGEPVAAVLKLLALEEPLGHARFLLASARGAESEEAVDRLYRELVEGYGEGAVRDAVETLNRLWYGQLYHEADATRDRAAALRKEREDQQDALDHRLLLEILDRGAVAVLGEPGSPLTDEERLLREAERYPMGLERDLFLFRQRWQRISYPALEEFGQQQWLSLHILVSSSWDYFRRRTRDERSDARHAETLRTAFHTLRAECEKAGNSAAVGCQLEGLLKEALEPYREWLPAGYDQPSNADEGPEPASGGRLQDMAGEWEGEVEQAGTTYPVRVSLIPAEAVSPQERVGTTEYPTFRCGGELFLLQAQDDAIRLQERITSGQRTCLNGFVRVRLLGPDRLEMHWGMASGILTRR